MFAKFSSKISGKSARDKIFVGLDIGTQVVKIVKLRIAQDVVELVDFVLEPMQADPIEVFKKLKSAHSLEAVNIAFSGPSTVIRDINFPKMTAPELKQALKFEVQKHIPFPLAEVNLDGCILKDDLPDNKMLVLLAAVKKDFLSQRLKFIEDAGLKVNIIEIDSLALINAFNFNYGSDDYSGKKAIALLNVGATITNVSIIEDGLPRVSRDIQIGGNNFTQKISEVMGVDFRSAENLKINPAGDQAARMMTDLETVFTNLGAEIRTSFDYYESQSASSVGKIYLSGGGSLFTGFKEKISGLLGIGVEYWDCLSKIKQPNIADAEKLKPVLTQLNVAVGLALRK
ncbi:MAG: type IV pilus assembly protein PilM [Candidatus Omnitrophica bacterium]|nr:type IV pilus assembly protein PilM [Candidatus Omnitrophota bacterium]